MHKIKGIFFAILLMTVGAFAQSQSTTGNIEGRVLDPNGAVVPNVNVSATNQDTGFGKTVMTDGDGDYLILLLPPGRYKVEVKAASGFSPATFENVTVSVGGKTKLDVTLSVGSNTTVVDVQADGAVIETSRTSISSTVDERRVINLPTNGRNFLDFATLTPGIVRDPTRSGDLAVGGQKGTLNSLQIDGTSSDNTFFGQSSGRIGSGRAPSQFSIDTVKEFQVNQNGFSAEYGRAAGAVINVVTKSGTNRFSGSLFEYFRDESLNARNPNLVAANRPRPAGQINQFGGTFGGPFKKDKAFFFGAYEGQRSNLPNPVVLRSLPFAPANVQALLGPKVVSYNIDRVQDNFLFKTDFNINDRNQVWIRFNQQNFKGTNLENSGTLSAEEHTGNSNVTTSTLTGNWTHTLTPKWFNELRIQFSRDSQPGLANTDSPEVSVVANAGGINDGTFSFGRNNFSPRETTITRYQFINNQTYLVGNHTFKYGVDLLFDRIFNFFPGLFGGSYTFSGGYTQLSNYLNGVPNVFPTTYRQSFAGAGTTGGTTKPNNNEYGFFVQDDWRIRPNLTLNVGVRYDYQLIAKPPIQNTNNVTVQDPNNFFLRTTSNLLNFGYDTGFRPSDTNNLAPRLGLSYAINEKTVIRGGYGLFFGRTPAIMTGTAHSQNGIQVVAISITCSAVNVCPTYPNVFTSVPTGASRAPVNLYLFSQEYKQPYTHQARLQFEREVFKNTTFSVQYTLFRGNDLSRTRNVNLFPTQDVTVGGLTFQRFQTERERFGDATTNNSSSRFRPLRSKSKEPRTVSFAELASTTWKPDLPRNGRNPGALLSTISNNPLMSAVAGQTFQPIATPLTFSGFSPETLNQFAPQLMGAGLLPVSSVGGAARLTPLKKADETTLVGGDSVSMQLTRGDFSIAAAGTVTFRDGEKIYAFGHPFLNLGSSDLPMSESHVVTVIPNVNNSFKLAVPDAMVGTMTQDRSTGVFGKLGQAPKMIPVEINLETSRGQTETFTYEVVKDEFLSPLLLNITIYNALIANERSLGDSMIEVKGEISIKGQDAVKLENRFGGMQSTQLAALSVALPVNALLKSNFDELQISGIKINLTSSDGSKNGTLERIAVDRTRVKAGENIELQAFVRTDAGRTFMQKIPFQIPADTGTGVLSILVGDGNTVQQNSVAQQFLPKTLAELIATINNLRKADRLYVQSFRTTNGAVVGANEMPNLPPSVLATMNNDRTAGGFKPTVQSVVAEREIAPAEFLIYGQQTLTVEIVK